MHDGQGKHLSQVSEFVDLKKMKSDTEILITKLQPSQLCSKTPWYEWNGMEWNMRFRPKTKHLDQKDHSAL